jgi:hypothetical protein
VSPPEVPQIIEITPTVRFLLQLAAAAFAALLGATGYLLLRVWKIARAFERKSRTLAMVNPLVRAVFGFVTRDGRSSPGLVQRVGDLEEDRAPARALPAIDIDQPGNTFSGVRGHFERRAADNTGSHRAIAAAMPDVPELDTPDSDDD